MVAEDDSSPCILDIRIASPDGIHRQLYIKERTSTHGIHFLEARVWTFTCNALEDHHAK